MSGEICFDNTLISKQKYTYEASPHNFFSELARARTFGYVEQVEELWANGLALGSSLANVIAIHWNRQSVLNEDGLRYADEFIRHKVVDLLGDLSLLGHRLHARVCLL
jgi:UDP-3-O-[3-hydroxymyristoyl] N-acetylglucosamine deacetylase